jgi:hypothetical protein
MEEQQNQPVENGEQSQGSSFQNQGSQNDVSFPTVGGEKKSGGAKMLLIVGILILVAILGFVIYKSASKKSGDMSTEVSPLDNVTTPSDQTVQTITPAPSPSVTVDKTKVKIQVQNGTGISGEASYLQTQLGKLGYTNIKTGNATATVTAATATFSSTLDSGVVTEITNKLNSIYQSVTTNTSTSATFDAVIVTGLQKGATPKPSSAPVASPSSSPTPTAAD